MVTTKEPKNCAAAVIDADGHSWTRDSNEDVPRYCYWTRDDGEYASWDGIPQPVKVAFRGIPQDADDARRHDRVTHETGPELADDLLAAGSR